MNHLTTTDNIKSGTRFVSKHLDDSRIEPCIKESEQENIKPRIGDELFIDLLAYVDAEDKSSFPDYSVLIGGGVYTDRRGEQRSIEGLVEALNYYTFARIVKNNNYSVTRFGTVNKTENYSQNAELRERLVLEKEALRFADTYMSECIEYLNDNRSSFPKYRKGQKYNRLNISIIGD